VADRRVVYSLLHIADYKRPSSTYFAIAYRAVPFLK
jgi:hypothetical protein